MDLRESHFVRLAVPTVRRPGGLLGFDADPAEVGHPEAAAHQFEDHRGLVHEPQHERVEDIEGDDLEVPRDREDRGGSEVEPAALGERGDAGNSRDAGVVRLTVTGGKRGQLDELRSHLIRLRRSRVLEVSRVLSHPEGKIAEAAVAAVRGGRASRR